MIVAISAICDTEYFFFPLVSNLLCTIKLSYFAEFRSSIFMLGKFQTSELRIEVKATSSIIHDSLMNLDQLQKWFFPLQFIDHNSSVLEEGDVFDCNLGAFKIKNKVKIINNNCFRLILSGGIDGYQEWCWGDGWVQSRLEGVSLLPLNLSQTLNLLRLKSWLGTKTTKDDDTQSKNTENNNPTITEIDIE